MKQILVVDDEESIRLTLSALLQHRGYRVVTTGAAENALEILEQDSFEFVLVDVRMPGMDGIELTRRILAAGTPITVIVMSAYGSVDNAIEAMKAGAYDYISKPFKPDEVILTLAKAEERESLRRENARLKADLLGRHESGGIVAKSASMKEILRMVGKIADYKSTVLISGESGTGKELVARAIHNGSSRAKGPFVAINCGAIPESLLESELFGYRRGAFTDAHADKPGLFAEAEGGSLLLDEIGELPLALQVKLLRALQENTIRRIGDTKDTPVNVRIIAATVRELGDEVKKGCFREDLFYRLNVLPIHVPPLRERTEDIVLLSEHFIAKHNRRLNMQIKGMNKEVERLLLGYAWPGNVRELENVVERAMVLAEGELLTAHDLPTNVREVGNPIQQSLDSGELSVKKTIRIIEEELIRRALEKSGGNRTLASKYLEISHRALLYKIKSYGIG